MSVERRLEKLEKAVGVAKGERSPSGCGYILVFTNDETEEEAHARHLEEHPEDKHWKPQFIHVVFVEPKKE